MLVTECRNLALLNNKLKLVNKIFKKKFVLAIKKEKKKRKQTKVSDFITKSKLIFERVKNESFLLFIVVVLILEHNESLLGRKYIRSHQNHKNWNSPHRTLDSPQNSISQCQSSSSPSLDSRIFSQQSSLLQASALLEHLDHVGLDGQRLLRHRRPQPQPQLYDSKARD
jgi:hypothetical protein